MEKKQNSLRGFTLIELLIVIGILGIIAAVVFVALDPGTRFEDARDARRWSDASAIIDAIKVDQVDNGGSFISAVSSLTDDTVYMIGTGSSGCNATCDTPALTTDACVDLTGLVTEGYLGQIPVSPDGTGTWSASLSGYTMKKTATGIVSVYACESENTGSISITR